VLELDESHPMLHPANMAGISIHWKAVLPHVVFLIIGSLLEAAIRMPI
jgi:hypothetical protein